jgi:hypothetical protein
MLEEHLYSPLKFYLHNPREEEENGEYGSNNLYDESYKIPNNWALEYSDAIELAIRRDREWMDKTHGLAEYLPDELRQKICSVFPDIKVMNDGQLYCSAKMELTAALTPNETAALKDYWSGQLSDGWGEGFEQREVKIKDEELYIVPWSSDKNEFFIDTREEFNWRVGTVPPAIKLDGRISGDVFANFIEQLGPVRNEEGLALNAIYALLVFSQEAAAKNLPDWVNAVTAARDMAVSIARYAELEPNKPYGSWFSVFNVSIKIGRIAPENLPKADLRLYESGIRGLAWFACKMADYNAAGIDTHIARVQGMMKQIADYWGFDESLCSELNAIINEARNNNPDNAQPEHNGSPGICLQESALSGTTELKLYSPVYCELRLFTPQQYSEETLTMTQRQAAMYYKQIHDAVIKERLPDEAVRGSLTNHTIAEETDTDKKVNSVLVDVEVHNGELWAVATLNTIEAFTEADVKVMRDMLAEQYSDLFGEDFRRHPVQIPGAEIEVSLYAMNNSFFIDTPEQFSRRLDIHPSKLAVSSEDIDSASLPDPTGTSYVFAVTDDSDSYIPNALHVERDDNLMIFEADADATEAAGQNGVPLITGIAGVPDGVYIDTPENREVIGQWTTGIQHYDELKQRLCDRLTKNFADYKSEMMDASKESLFKSAAEIASAQEAFDYFTQEYDFRASDLDFLLKFQNPLELLSDKWVSPFNDVNGRVASIFSEQERTLQKGGYILAPDEHSSSEPNRAAHENETGYTSVVDRIRRDKEERRGCQLNQRDSLNREKKRRDEEL